MIVGSWLPDATGDKAFLWQAGEWQTLPPASDGIFSGATAINGAGQIVGHRDVDSATRRAFFWQDGVFTDIAPTFGTVSIAENLNEAGVVVGWMGHGTFDRHAFVWQDDFMVDLGPVPGGTTSIAKAVNGSGDVVGGGRIRSADGNDHVSQSFL